MRIQLITTLLFALALSLTSESRSLRADEDAPKTSTKAAAKKMKAAPKVADEKENDDQAKAEDDGPPPVSVVLLHKRLPKLTEQQVLAKIKSAWQIDLSSPEDGTENDEGFVVKGGPGFIIRTKTAQYMMIVAEKPYLKVETIEEVEELRLKNMLNDHQAWISVDLLIGDEPLSETAKAREWKRVASLAAELLNDNTVGVILPEPNVIVVRNDGTAELLRQKDPVKALRESLDVAVVGTSDDDPEMKQAVDDARKSWPAFVKAFEAKAEGTENFGVKFPFDAPDNKEFMWIEVTSVDDTFVHGKLANDPVWVKDLKLGSKVRKKVSEVADWMYIRDGEIVGGYSVKVLMKRQAESQENEDESK
jgi:uncharacterized protein YegJ (DUF2314 family)